MLLPYLHERKVYLNQIERTHKFFYNVVNEEFDDEKAKDGKIQKGKKYIFAINLTKYYYDVYTLRGIKLRRVSYKKFVKEYGTPLQVSNNGKNFVFQKIDDLFNLHIICFTSKQAVYMKKIHVQNDIHNYVGKMIHNCRLRKIDKDNEQL